jgi:hypothetical protein
VEFLRGLEKLKSKRGGSEGLLAVARVEIEIRSGVWSVIAKKVFSFEQLETVGEVEEHF